MGVDRSSPVIITEKVVSNSEPINKTYTFTICETETEADIKVAPIVSGKEPINVSEGNEPVKRKRGRKSKKTVELEAA